MDHTTQFLLLADALLFIWLVLLTMRVSELSVIQSYISDMLRQQARAQITLLNRMRTTMNNLKPQYETAIALYTRMFANPNDYDAIKQLAEQAQAWRASGISKDRVELLLRSAFNAAHTAHLAAQDNEAKPCV